ncbi:MAG: RNA-binding protein [Candidatus Diapherotrites archaeon]|nr:RNA-binding protein [Candidatus Diapherotrites archaeon]
MREVVIPGEKIAGGKELRAGHGTFKKKDGVYADVMGLVDTSKGFAKVVPLNGRYMPREGDHVIGIIEGLMGKGCFVDINSAYTGYLSFFGDREYKIGDLMIMEIKHVNEINKMDLDFAKPLYGGKLINVSPVKIPRIVGRQASMVETLAAGSNCRIFVGRNGRIYIKGEEEDIARAEAAIRLIEREAHTKGLTDRIKKLLETGGKDGNEK